MAKGSKVTVDVTQERRAAPRFSRETPASMALKFGGHIEGLTAPLELDQRVFLVVDATVKSVGHNKKASDKAVVLARDHTVSVEGGWVLDAAAGLSLVEALRIAREEANGVAHMPGMAGAGDGPDEFDDEEED